MNQRHVLLQRQADREQRHLARHTQPNEDISLPSLQELMGATLHAQSCKRVDDCRVPHCESRKLVIEHLRTCTRGRECTYAGCFTLLLVINHWKSCKMDECLACRCLQTSMSTPIGLKVLDELKAMIGRRVFDLTMLPLPDPPSTPKVWHEQATADLRNHIVRRIVKEIWPGSLNALTEQQLNLLISAARKVENNLLEIADSRVEYFYLLPLQTQVARKVWQKNDAHNNSGQQQENAENSEEYKEPAFLQHSSEPVSVSAQGFEFDRLDEQHKQKVIDEVVWSLESFDPKRPSLATQKVEIDLSSLPPLVFPSPPKIWQPTVSKELRLHLTREIVRPLFVILDHPAREAEMKELIIMKAREAEKASFELANEKEEYYYLIRQNILSISNGWRKKRANWIAEHAQKQAQRLRDSQMHQFEETIGEDSIEQEELSVVENSDSKIAGTSDRFSPTASTDEDPAAKRPRGS